jgi:hypothetical protein
VTKGLIGHHRPEIGPADPDVDHVANTLAGIACPFAATDPVGEVGHAVEHGMDLRHDIPAVDPNRGAGRGAQRGVQHGAVFRDIDLLTGKHVGDPLLEAGFPCEPHQKLDGLVRNQVLRVIQLDAHGRCGQALAARGILGEELAEVRLPNSLVMRPEGLPHQAANCRLRRRFRFDCFHFFGVLSRGALIFRHL